ncbi:MAG: hypothetical protein DMF63_00535 [Acidobacteria bacterium]|nr:MAG: hypothetical protein DMF63_00535 [Acidobacteriota bacterium]
MQPNPIFLRQPKSFWANVRSLSQQLGYTRRGTGQVRVPTVAELRLGLEAIGLGSSHVVDEGGNATELGQLLLDYFQFRADVLNDYVRVRLMDVAKAAETFNRLSEELCPTCPLPMNKQKGEKAAPAFFTGIINTLIEANANGLPCDYDPRKLTSVTLDGSPLRTLARRVDGAFTSAVNPIAIWEIKEYYYTTTFGSRVADGVYESLLDGMELEELREHENIDVKHYLMVDDYNTWWNMGRSYLCRIIDMLHMGYLDEALFGYEVVERLPAIVAEWVAIHEARL